MKFYQPYKFYRPNTFQKKVLLEMLHSLDITSEIHKDKISIEDKEYQVFTRPGKNILYTNELLDKLCDNNMHNSLAMIAISLGWDETIKGKAHDQDNNTLRTFIYTRDKNHMPKYYVQIKDKIINFSDIIATSLMLEDVFPFFNSWYKQDGKYHCKREPLFNAKEEILNTLSL